LIGVFGGSGFYSFLDDVTEVSVDTPYGAPSAPFAIGEVGGRKVAFLPRHGRRHELPPARVPYRANLWAMRELGVERIFGPCAVGSLQRHVEPGHIVVCDQLVDRTHGRADTYYDGPRVQHVSLADPYCPELRSALAGACAAEDVTVHERGTVVVVPGPRFSTRAESQSYRAAGWDVVNMTQYPEATLARELGICYATAAVVTDYDSGLQGVAGIEPVTMEQIFRAFEANLARLRAVLFRAIAAVPSTPACECHAGLDESRLSRG